MSLPIHRTSYNSYFNKDLSEELIAASCKGSLSMVRSLVESGAHIDASDINGGTALMWACFYGHIDVVKFLLDYGAQIEAVQNQGLTPLMLAAQGGHAEVVQLLVERGADVHVQDGEEETALMMACLDGHVEAARILTSRCTNIEQKNIDGDTALHLSAGIGNTALMELLFSSGASLDAKNNRGETPFLVAKFMAPYDRYQEVRRFFSENIPEYQGEYDKFHVKTRRIYAIFGIDDDDRTPKAETIPFEREGFYDPYMARYMLKAWNEWKKERPDALSEEAFHLVRQALETQQNEEHLTVDELVEHYLSTGSLIFSTGYAGHSMKALLWDKYMIHVNRGDLDDAISRFAKTVHIFRFSRWQLSDKGFLSEYISKMMELRVSERSVCNKFLRQEFRKKYYRPLNPILKNIEKSVQLPHQTSDNCSWASLEGTITVLLAMDALKSRGVFSSGETTSIKRTVDDVKAVFADFIRFIKEKSAKQYSYLQQQDQEEHIINLISVSNVQ